MVYCGDMKRIWEYIGGNQWSLVDYDTEYEDHVCSIEIERGKCPSVAYLDTILTKQELQELINLIYENTLDR